MSSKHQTDYQKIKEFDSVDCDAKVEVYRHIKTSLRVIRVRCKSDETFFSFSIPTKPQDSTGVFHIIEHTALSSSQDFPMKDPFTMAMAQTSCSFLNAMTYPEFTSFPASGKILHDLEKIFCMYADAVFFPNLKKGAFLQEGIRYSLKDGKIAGFDGVVFNEMSENYDARIEVATRAKNAIVYRGTPCEFEYGGDIKYIPFLTYENYLKYYRANYKYSFSTLVLYGNDDCDYFMDILSNKILSKPRCEALEPSDYNLPQKTCSGDNTFYFNSKDNRYPSFFVLIKIDIPEDDSITFRSLGILSHALLSSSKSDLFKELLKSESFKDISSLSGIERRLGVCTFIIGLDDLSVQDRDRIDEKYTQIIRSSLLKLLKNGLNKKNLASSIKAIKLETLEGASFHETGIRITERVMKNPAYYENYFDLISDIEKIEAIFEENPKYFDEIFRKYIAENDCFSTFCVYPDDDFDKKFEEEKKDAIRTLNQIYTEGELKEDLATFEEYMNRKEEYNPDDYFSFATSKELIEYAEYDDLVEIDYKGAKCLFKKVDRKGLSYINVIFDISDLSDYEIKNISILCEILNDSAKMDLRDNFFTILNFYAHNLSFSSFAYKRVDGVCKIALKMSFYSLSEDVDVALDKILEYIKGFSITKKGMRQVFNEIYSYFNEDAASLAPLFSLTLASIPLVESSFYTDIISGIGFKDYISGIKRDSFYSLSQFIKNLSVKVFSKKRCIFHITAHDFDKKSFEKFASGLFESNVSNRPLISQFDKKEIYTYPLTGSLSYSTLAFLADTMNPTFDVLSQTIQNTTLWHNIRVKGGAYGAKCDYNYYTGLFVLSSYRDPRFKESFDDFIKSLDVDVDNNVLENSKNAFFTDLVNEPTLAKKAWYSTRNYIMGITNELRKERFEKALKLTLKDAKNDLKRLKEYSKNNIKASVTAYCENGI